MRQLDEKDRKTTRDNVRQTDMPKIPGIGSLYGHHFRKPTNKGGVEQFCIEGH